MKTVINRVYGLIGISSVMANWNADFTGRPKSLSNGELYGSDKAIKYSMKKIWENEGEKVLYIKSYKIDEKKEKGKIQPKGLEERYEQIFSTSKLDKKTPSKEVLKNLFSAIDVMNFGATFAVENQNISINGAVQIGQGFNKYEDSNVEIQDILSPFRNSKKDDAEASSLGKKIMSDEAHYVYNFSINPNNYNDYIGLVDDFKGYTKEAYDKFKHAALIGATALNTNSKSGCENEFAIFIECKEKSELYLANIDKYVFFEKGDKKNIINLESLSFLNNDKFSDNIDNIEIYYNEYTTEIKHGLEKAKEYNIFTKEEIK
ncbi:CRISPR-associated protein [Clostridium sporogenes]|uniref:type I CRISPR-associated protein Cas7 n=1 Tax=Clostridium sporogenes TaxID=1509 RepID=UPI0013FA1D72|nr:type I CRISPR-associated protein Cas7 [Clostridium sporogenes]NFV11668.1 CRISPR-associated protein [Clostridium sporogenes]